MASYLEFYLTSAPFWAGLSGSGRSRSAVSCWVDGLETRDPGFNHAASDVPLVSMNHNRRKDGTEHLVVYIEK